MKRLMVAIALGLSSVAGHAQETAIAGTALRAGTGDPVPSARILLTRMDGPMTDPVLTRTDDRGRFLFRGVPPGHYRIVATHEGYVRSVGAPFVASLDQPAAPVIVMLTPTGVVTGRVVDAFSDPVARVYVRASTDDAVYEAQTDDRGEYRLFGLPPGSYVVSAAPYTPPRIERGTTYAVPTPPGPYSRGEGQSMMPLGRLLAAGDYVHPLALTGDTYARVYYAGATEPDAATPVDVAPGAVVGGIDFTLVVVPAR